MAEATGTSVEQPGQTLSRIILQDKVIHLVGTAHVSRQSLDDVDKAIRDFSPDHICVELDRSRLEQLDKGGQWSGSELKTVLRKGQGFLMLTNLALASFQRRMGRDSGVMPGAEMKHAVSVARKENIPFTCADRSVRTTLTRAWRASGLWSRLKLVSALVASAFSSKQATAEEIEQLKGTDAMTNLMQELSDFLPSVKTVLVDERDLFLSVNIFSAPGKNILAVVGAAHVPGIMDMLQKLASGELDPDLEPVSAAPGPSLARKFLPWIVPLVIVTLLALGIIRSGLSRGIEMSLVWVLANGIPAAVGALIALAHPLTILISFLGAPITSLNPTIGVGMIAGLLEYYFRQPRVADMESLNTDIQSFRGWYANRVTRILLVFFFSSLGSSLGTVVAIPWLTGMLGT